MKKMLEIAAETIKRDVAYFEGKQAACRLFCNVMDKRGKKWNKQRFIMDCGLVAYKDASGNIIC